MVEQITVLHVDDEPGFRELTQSVLEADASPITVKSAVDASDALEKLDTTEIDCIVSDYQMPDLNGIELLERVRERDEDIPFILFTGKGSEAVASDAIAAGVTDYLQKQGGLEQFELLENRITNAVDRYQAIQRTRELERIRTVLRDVNQSLLRAQTREEIETRVCEILSEADPYRFAWIGEHDETTQRVIPQTAAGVEEGYLDEIEVTTDDSPTGQGPTGRAIRQRELVVMQNIPEDPEYEPWREQALERGYRSSAAIPLGYDETLYGVLNVYANRSHAFDDVERELLAELGADTAHALHRATVRARQDRYERLIENLPVGVYRTTPEPDGEFIDVNPALADILGVAEPEELLGESVTSFYADPTDRTHLSDQIDESGVVHGKELQLTTVDGDPIWVISTAIRTTESGKTYYDGIIQDITARKAREQQLESQSAELKRRHDRLTTFADVLAHDISNHLNVASLHLDLATESRDLDYCEHIEAAHDRIESIVDEMKSLVDAGTHSITKEWGQLSAVAKVAWQSCCIQSEDAELRIANDGQVRADRHQLTQLFENLFWNACDHAGDDPTVTVGILDDGFYVADDGPGIPSEHGDDIFKPGYSTAKGEHMGFGLAIVQEIIRAHDWKVTVTESDAGGARFECTDVEVRRS